MGSPLAAKSSLHIIAKQIIGQPAGKSFIIGGYLAGKSSLQSYKESKHIKNPRKTS